MRSNICLAALAATLVTATPALAAPGTASATAEARGVVLQPLTLVKLQDLDFGTVVGSGAAGTVSIDPDTGTRTVTGGVTAVPSFPGDRALFQGAGSINQDVLLSMTVPTVLVSTANPADTINVTSMTFDNGNTTLRNLGASGIIQFGIGGDFAIAANQPAGLYTANFDVTADYQ